MNHYTKRLIEQAMLTADGMRQRAVRLIEFGERLQTTHAIIGSQLRDEGASLSYRAGELFEAARLAKEPPHSTGPFTVSTDVSDPRYIARVMTADGDIVCDVRQAGPNRMSLNEARGNPDHIALCLGAHEPMVAALRGAMDALEFLDANFAGNEDKLKAAVDVLAMIGDATGSAT